MITNLLNEIYVIGLSMVEKYDGNRLVKILPFEGVALGERRQVRFLEAFGLPPEYTRVVAFGKCNMKCPGCFRDAQKIDDDNNVADSIDIRPPRKIAPSQRGQSLIQGY